MKISICSLLLISWRSRKPYIFVEPNRKEPLELSKNKNKKGHGQSNGLTTYHSIKKYGDLFFHPSSSFMCILMSGSPCLIKKNIFLERRNEMIIYSDKDQVNMRHFMQF